jgi:hypothetical protein
LSDSGHAKTCSLLRKQRIMEDACICRVRRISPGPQHAVCPPSTSMEMSQTHFDA